MNMNNKHCEHILDNGKSAIIVDNKKWFGVYPKKIKGICKICMKTFEFTECEYKKIFGGE